CGGGRCAAADRGSEHPLLNALETSGAVDNLTATLESASRAADAAADGVPLLIEDLNTLSSRLAALPIDPLIERANGVLLGAEAFLASPGIRDAPEALRGSLEALTRVLNSVEREGVVAELGSTLNSAGSAANALAIASNDLPRLVEEIAGLAEQAERTLATYGEGSPVNYEAVTAIRDIRDTARAVTALARSIERNPTAWLRGR
ncbi:MAG: MCE family protein, partial [Pseudomonadota bacterium]